MNIPDLIPESLETIFWNRILKFFDADPDPGSGIFVTPDPGWKIFGPGYGINILNPQHCPPEFRLLSKRPLGLTPLSKNG